MILIKLQNWNKGRNVQTFKPLLGYGQYFEDIGIQFIEDGISYDYEFIGTEDFVDKNLPLSQSIEKGLENLKNITGDYFLFDGTDSTSLMGSIEVFLQSNAKFLFKNQILSRKDYQEENAFGRWFFGKDKLNLGYNLTQEQYNKIKLSGWNLGYYNLSYNDFGNEYEKKLDVCAIFQGTHNENYEHTYRNDLLYSQHRKKVWEVLEKSSGFDYAKDKLPREIYASVLAQSKIAISPFGMGEICFRDFEIMQMGVILLKPDMGKIITKPNIYKPYETYIPCKPDWSDLNEQIYYILDNYNECKDMVQNMRDEFKKQYTVENLLLHWYDFFKNLNNESYIYNSNKS